MELLLKFKPIIKIFSRHSLSEFSKPYKLIDFIQ